MGGGLCKSKPDPKKHNFMYDIIIIGGGSAGLACAREAVQHGALIALCDYVTPSPMGTTWGLGGTCVNVGCIPKRLMHQSSLIKDFMGDASLFGWKTVENSQVDWNALTKEIKEYISSLNFGYKMALRQAKITRIDGLASFGDEHHVKITYPDSDNEPDIISAQIIVLAVGGRPNYLDIPGGKPEDKLCITSDDIFYLEYPPGKTLCVGAGYISLECAGFLASFGYDVSVMCRSVLMRDFDKASMNLLASNMEGRTIRFIKSAEPKKITLVKEGNPPTLKVAYEQQGGKNLIEEEFNTVLLAVGRKPATKSLNLGALPKIKVDDDGYIITDKYDCTGVANIFAIGDCAKGVPKLTPAATKGGKWLARRIFDKSFNKFVNYESIPTALFTPIEYGCCGLSEEKANAEYGKDKVEVYHKAATPIEFSLNKRDGEAIYAKLICVKSGGKERIVGFHYLGPNAGEVTVGFQLAVKDKYVKESFDSIFEIHPTCAEIYADMTVSRRQQLQVKRQEGC